ncbi:MULTISPECIES: hypothetical protein [Saccharothrix]|uniref:hypothetical protein n=1 Tax=Saccharothrix TaxID=2071 RepID=UPI00093EA831|nr:hypothetical protein [Saccharothrix sp. CB00851]OKI32492.1 hypothetical protein A6A25_25560 [Saccharothrix sp. CB00851]
MSDLSRPIRHFHHDGTVRHELARRPFLPFDARFADVLIRDFAIPALRWLHGHSTGAAPSTLVSAHAEVAMTASATIELITKANGAAIDAAREDLLVKCVDGVVWLYRQATFHEDGTCCFDHSSYDTSTVARALFDALRHESLVEELATRGIPSMDKVILGSARWLLVRFDQADRGDIGAMLNPSEYAQIGRALAVLTERYDLDEHVGAHTRYQTCSEVISRILMTLFERKSERMVDVTPEGGGNRTLAIWWDDFFGTSEVLLFLGAVSDSADHGRTVLTAVERAMIRECIARCFLLVEHSQADGLWGGYLDTVGVLNAYVSISENSKRLFNEGRGRHQLVAQPRIVFRAVRWVCDPTQRSSDGSVLHTAWLTTLFVIALVRVATMWEYSDRTVGELYDDLSMAMDRGISEHRASQISAILDRENALEKLAAESALLHRARAVSSHLRWVRSRFALTVLVIVLGGATATSVGTLGGIFTVEFHSKNTADVLSLVALTTAGVLAIITVLWSVGRPPE